MFHFQNQHVTTQTDCSVPLQEWQKGTGPVTNTEVLAIYNRPTCYISCILQSHHQFVCRDSTSDTHFGSVWWDSRRWECQLWLRVSMLCLTPPGKWGTIHWNGAQNTETDHNRYPQPTPTQAREIHQTKSHRQNIRRGITIADGTEACPHRQMD